MLVLLGGSASSSHGNLGDFSAEAKKKSKLFAVALFSWNVWPCSMKISSRRKLICSMQHSAKTYIPRQNERTKKKFFFLPCWRRTSTGNLVTLQVKPIVKDGIVGGMEKVLLGFINK